MQQITTPWWMNLQDAFASRPEKSLTFLSATFSKKLHPSIFSQFSQSWECRCLAHIINLAMQALISSRSKAKFYSADIKYAHLPEMVGTECDELGLVQAICIKVNCPFLITCTYWAQIRHDHPRNASSCSKRYKNRRMRTHCNCSLIWKSIGAQCLPCWIEWRLNEM